jgi:hypothetical protein
MRGRETPENRPLTILKGFSTVSEEVLGSKKNLPPRSDFEGCTYYSSTEANCKHKRLLEISLIEKRREIKPWKHRSTDARTNPILVTVIKSRRR